MHTQSATSTASTLTTVILGVMAQNLERFSSESLGSVDIALLESIARHASAIAQDARMTRESQAAAIEDFEQRERYGFDVHAACGY